MSIIILVAFILLITALVYAKRKKSKIIIVAATCFIISILLIGPNGEQKQNIVKDKVTQTQSSKKNDVKSSKNQKAIIKIQKKRKRQ